MIEYIIFITSMAVLVYGAEIAIKESEKIALYYNISHFVIGATLIAVGTSLPEMAASMSASFKNHADMAVANVVGSVIFNIALILGIIFIFSKNFNPKRDFFAVDSAWIVLPLGLFLIMIYDGVLDFVDGLLFLGLMGAYLLFLAKDHKNLESEIDEDLSKAKFAWPQTLGLLTLGFAMIIFGSDFAISSASSIALSLGVSEWVVGLLLVAFGTSLPELVVSVKAISKGHTEMTIGNIIGSNVANFSMVLGAASLLNPLRVDYAANGFDILVMVVVSVMFIFIIANKLYSKSAGIALLSVIILLLKNSFN